MMHRPPHAGFTLLETLVAVSLLVIAVIGPFIAARNAYLAALDSKNQFIASYLAQEGIEYVRTLRDDTYLADYQSGKGDLTNTAFYDDFLNNAGGVASSIQDCRDRDHDGTPDRDASNNPPSCAVDPALNMGVGTGLALQACTGACPLLLLQNGRYGLSAGQTTIYRRTVQFYDVGPLEEIKVTVAWTYHGSTHNVVLTDYLAPWE